MNYGDGSSDDLGSVIGTDFRSARVRGRGSFTPTVTATDTSGASATASTVIVVQPMIVSITASPQTTIRDVQLHGERQSSRHNRRQLHVDLWRRHDRRRRPAPRRPTLYTHRQGIQVRVNGHDRTSHRTSRAEGSSPPSPFRSGCRISPTKAGCDVLRRNLLDSASRHSGR